MSKGSRPDDPEQQTDAQEGMMGTTIGEFKIDWTRYITLEVWHGRKWANLLLVMLGRYFEAQRDCPACQARFQKLCDEGWGNEHLEPRP